MYISETHFNNAISYHDLQRLIETHGKQYSNRIFTNTINITDFSAEYSRWIIAHSIFHSLGYSHKNNLANSVFVPDKKTIQQITMSLGMRFDGNYYNTCFIHDFDAFLKTIHKDGLYVYDALSETVQIVFSSYIDRENTIKRIITLIKHLRQLGMHDKIFLDEKHRLSDDYDTIGIHEFEKLLDPRTNKDWEDSSVSDGDEKLISMVYMK